ncbi:MAG: hypothetical protein R3B54_07450 [Bdellovibrionota bacterium]
MGTTQTPSQRKEPVAFLGSRRGKPDFDVSSVQRRKFQRGSPPTNWRESTSIGCPGIFLSYPRAAEREYRLSFFAVAIQKPLLVLHFSKQRSTPARALFYIRGGILAKIQGRGRLEFREVLDQIPSDIRFGL